VEMLGILQNNTVSCSHRINICTARTMLFSAWEGEYVSCEVTVSDDEAKTADSDSAVPDYEYRFIVALALSTGLVVTYLRVISIELCPMSSATITRLKPFSINVVANVLRPE
jgi:hypothetical protein